MKTKKTYLIIAALFVAAIYSCKKNNPSPAASATLSFTVNGVAKSTNTISALNTANPSQLVVLATLGPTESLYFTIKNPKVGSFDVSGGAATIGYAASTDSTTVYTGTNGTVTLTSYSGNNATGTFEFSGSNVAHSSLNITGGTFQTN